MDSNNGAFNIPQMPGMPKTIDNIHIRVRDDLAETITKKSKLRIAAACFSIYAYEELKKSLAGIEELQFLFTLVLCQEKVQIKSAFFTLSYPAKTSAFSFNAA